MLGRTSSAIVVLGELGRILLQELDDGRCHIPAKWLVIHPTQ